MGSSSGAAQLLAKFESEALYLSEELDADERIRPIVLGIMDGLVPIIGGSETKLCVGSVTEALQPSVSELFRGGIPPAPYLYDFLVVTDSYLVISWGYLDPKSGQDFHETTNVRAINKITAVAQLIEPGMQRKHGPIATHHDIGVTFADGSTETLPGLEEGLSPSGCKRVAELPPIFYSAMAG